MQKTKIDWPDLAYTWNPIIGCKNGCTYCYAKKISNRFKMIPDFSEPTFFPNRLNDPLKVKKPATVFVGSMCDIFSEGVKREWIEEILNIVKQCPQHTFMFLTKIPNAYHCFSFPPDNCMLGTTIESSLKANKTLIMSGIKMICGNRIFASIEPILSIFDFVILDHFDLVIIGADSTPGAKIPPLEWVLSIKHPNIHYKQNLRKYYPQLKN